MSRLKLMKDKISTRLDVKKVSKIISSEDHSRREQHKLEKVFYIHGNFSEFYRELDILGEGCVGVVRRVERVSDERVFASKMVRTRGEEEIVQNVIREFKNQRLLSHPNIVAVYELYVDETKGRIYTIMELVEGKEMFDVISRLG